MSDPLPNYIASIITEDVNVFTEDNDDYFAGVAIVRCRDKWLLGLAKNTGDDRNNKWVFPGGGIKSGESPEKAAERECKEETGIKCRAASGVLDDRPKPGVAFVACKADQTQLKKLKPNHEFAALGWFTTKEMKSLDLYKNVDRLIKRAKRY